ncbi:thiol oxidoreductase [Pseudoalteromonas sp. DL2-H2.2]|uniref:di-heme oxidoreductase family protein n=1 Tax=Pseudoalteromonas sp. DL2-H2.2 TaxID=2908889 RepID=UPI001F4207A4|nr:di-heme oxidoredictase family protein [Pseudoalteromonas sp. DL2-H2.2]MCF2906774.1 thiol oxidoreductase [Pseudoalteromonas sp. DL2-H2.2]
MKYQLLILTLSLIISGCGGGSDTSQTNTNNYQQGTDNTGQTPDSSNSDNTDSDDNGGSDSNEADGEGDNDDIEGGQPDTSNHAFAFQVNQELPPLLIDTPDPNEHRSADSATTPEVGKTAYSQMLPAIKADIASEGLFKTGDHLFRTNHDGQGPLFNNATCQGCHIQDGRGVVPESPDMPMVSMFLRVGDSQGNLDPIYGDQIQVFGVIDGVQGGARAKYNGALDEGLAYGEAYSWIEYETIQGEFADGEEYTLRNPIYKVKDLSYGPFMEDVQFSARVSPPVFGTGLLESIPESSLLAYADPEDANQDGISGRPAYTTHPINGEKQLARFGYKAVTGSILQQISGAYRGDMGVTTSVTPEENCTSQQLACLAQADKEQDRHENGVDVTTVNLAQVEFYNRTLSVPVRRGYNESTQSWRADVLTGRAAFYQAKCHSCHVPRHKTGEAKGSVLGDVDLVGLKDTSTNISALEGLVIYPYTDLLLHDMGGSCQISRETSSGEACDDGAQCYYVQRCEGLADNRPEGEASGAEWKTPALWGIGLAKVVTERATFLHDGRATTIQEAILWHGGEAEAAKKAFLKMEKPQRAALLAFLESL